MICVWHLSLGFHTTAQLSTTSKPRFQSISRVVLTLRSTTFLRNCLLLLSTLIFLVTCSTRSESACVRSYLVDSDHLDALALAIQFVLGKCLDTSGLVKSFCVWWEFFLFNLYICTQQLAMIPRLTVVGVCVWWLRHRERGWKKDRRQTTHQALARESGFLHDERGSGRREENWRELAEGLFSPANPPPSELAGSLCWLWLWVC